MWLKIEKTHIHYTEFETNLKMSKKVKKILTFI